jgi:hypothetical protein
MKVDGSTRNQEERLERVLAKISPNGHETVRRTFSGAGAGAAWRATERAIEVIDQWLEDREAADELLMLPAPTCSARGIRPWLPREADLTNPMLAVALATFGHTVVVQADGSLLTDFPASEFALFLRVVASARRTAALLVNWKA